MVEVFDDKLQDTVLVASTPAWRVAAVTPTEDYKLHLRFADGSRKVYDMRPLLEWTVFEPLRNPGLFLQGHVDGGTVVWTDDIDIAPEELYENSVPVE